MVRIEYRPHNLTQSLTKMSSSLVEGSRPTPPRCRRKPRKPPNSAEMPRHGAQKDLSGDFVSGSHVAASNQTLNAWMGGRQPSWMTSRNPQSASGPHRISAPTTSNSPKDCTRERRPPSRSQRRPSNTAQDSARLTHGNHITTLTRHDATQENPVVPSELGKQTLDSAAALPSPAPTDQPSPPLVTSNQLHDQATFSDTPNCQSQIQSYDQSDVTSADQGGTSTNRLAIASHPQQGSTSNIETSVSAQAGRVSAPDFHITLRFALAEEDVQAVQSALDVPSPSPPPSTIDQMPSGQGVGTPQGPPDSATPMSEPQPSPSHLSTPISTYNNVPVVLGAPQLVVDAQDAATLAPNQGDGGAHQTETDAQKTAATFNLDCLHRVVMSQNLSQIIENCGGPYRLTADHTTGPRLNLLKEAVDLGDYFYLTLHQVLCVWSFSKSWVLHHLGKDPHVVESAMKMVQNTLRKNENMPQAIVLLLANFPESPHLGLWATEVYQKHIRDVAAFLQCLHEQWTSILIPSMKPQTGRGYPILAAELHCQLRLRSPVLEPVLFTVTRRHLGVPDGPIANQMHQLFQSDLKYDYDGMSERDRSNLRETMINSYKQLVLQSQGLLPAPTSSPAQGCPTTPMTMPQAMGRQQQMMEHSRRLSAGYSATSQAARSPNLNGTGQGIDMYPSPAVPSNLTAIPQHYALRSNNPMVANGGRQIPMQQPMSRPPMTGQFSHPLTPAGFPPYANSQLSNMGRMVPARGQSSAVLQAPPGGLSISLPMVTSPTRPSGPHGAPLRGPAGQTGFLPNNGFQGQPTYSAQQAFRQQAIQSHQIRQAGQILSRQQSQTLVQSLSPRVLHTATAPPAQGSPRRLQTNLPHGQIQNVFSPTSSENQLRASNGRPRSSCDGRARPHGALLRPHYQVPLDRFPHSPYEPKALMMSLHQVDVRSPRRVPRELPVRGEKSVRHYQSIKSLALGPVPTQPRYELHRLEFSVANDDFDKLSTTRFPVAEQIPVSQYFNGSLRYRLRLCELPLDGSKSTVPEAIWAMTPTYWPDHISIKVNGQVMKVRRKQHNGQHLPMELTSCLRRGTNTVSVGITPQPCAKKKPHLAYFMAVEVIETLEFQSILNLVLEQGVVPGDITRKDIQKRLKLQQPGGDDDIAIVDSDLSINVADPFCSSIFEIPVRGAQCSHMECFDLVTWLNTRPAKPMCTLHGEGCRLACSGSDLGPEPSFVDKWKCPLCDGDARPYSLRMDKFMADVRAKLEADGQLHTKTIHVAADGSWRPKVEEECDDEDEDMENKLPPAKRVKTGPSRLETPAIEIIELD